MKYIIAAPSIRETAVQVEFFEEATPHLVFRRAVNAVFDEQGGYDEEATTERVAQVAEGVANKLKVGAIQMTDLNKEVQEPEQGESE